MKTAFVQKSLVLNDKGQILIVRRSDTDDRRPLQWDLPGGTLEDDEEMVVGLEREILEETSLTVDRVHLVFSKTEYREWKGGEGSVVFLLYASHLKSGEVILSNEHDKYEWKTIQEALPMFEYPLHLEFLTYILEHKVAL